MFVNYAHRGASSYAPDSTEPAFDLGIEMKANGIETDMHATADGEIVLFHNEMLDGRSSGTGELKNYTLKELKEMDFGSWKDEKFKGEKIMTLKEFADKYFSLDMTFALEFKARGCEEKVLEILSRYDCRNKIYLTSFQYDILENVRKLDKDIRISWLVKSFDQSVLDRLKLINGTQICPEASKTEQADVDLAHANGLEVRAWGVADETLMVKMYNMNIEGMTVNFPDKLYELMNK